MQGERLVSFRVVQSQLQADLNCKLINSLTIIKVKIYKQQCSW